MVPEYHILWFHIIQKILCLVEYPKKNHFPIDELPFCEIRKRCISKSFDTHDNGSTIEKYFVEDNRYNIRKFWTEYRVQMWMWIMVAIGESTFIDPSIQWIVLCNTCFLLSNAQSFRSCFRSEVCSHYITIFSWIQHKNAWLTSVYIRWWLVFC